MTQHMIISHEGGFKEHFFCMACPPIAATSAREAEQSPLAEVPYFYSEEHVHEAGWGK